MKQPIWDEGVHAKDRKLVGKKAKDKHEELVAAAQVSKIIEEGVGVPRNVRESLLDLHVTRHEFVFVRVVGVPRFLVRFKLIIQIVRWILLSELEKISFIIQQVLRDLQWHESWLVTVELSYFIV